MFDSFSDQVSLAQNLTNYKSLWAFFAVMRTILTLKLIIYFLMRDPAYRSEKNPANENSKKSVIWLWLCLSCT